MKATCPNNLNHKTFEVVAHVSQSWKVNEKGYFLEVLEDAIDIIHEPDRDDIWTCIECGREAIVE